MFNFLNSINNNIKNVMLAISGIYIVSFNTYLYAQNSSNSNSNSISNQIKSKYNIKQGQQLALACLSCHSSPNIPNLYNIPKEILQQKIHDYAKDVKKDTIMHQLIKGYSDKDIELITQYFSLANKNIENGDK